ncbi:NupC/NupG family nucleoside CNT transporter [Beijerinckia indica]|nr:nucleoside transporter C-terminal domain-containing protein [Beijerinckia indica]
MTILHGFLGLLSLLIIAWLFSEDRWHVPLRLVIGGVMLQFALALLLMKFPPATLAFARLNDAVNALQEATDAGTSFVFGYLGGGPLPFAEIKPGASFLLGFRAFPLVLVISALASLLLYWGVLQKIVGFLAWGLRRSLGIGGALGLGAAVHIFVGMIEAPLLVRPYLIQMKRGELFALMSCGMAGIAGTVMVIYASLLESVIPQSLGNILIASVISTPAALAIAALMVPFAPKADERSELRLATPPSSAMEAITQGTQEGIGFLAGIIAMLIVLVALVTLVNKGLALLPFADPITLQGLFAWLFKPIMWLIGIPGQDIETAARLMGTKMVLNEFVAYLDLAHLSGESLEPRSRLMLTYALCGFANFGSLGIMIGGMSAMAPERKQEIAKLAPRSLISGTLATCMSGAVAGLLN